MHNSAAGISSDCFGGSTRRLQACIVTSEILEGFHLCRPPRPQAVYPISNHFPLCIYVIPLRFISVEEYVVTSTALTLCLVEAVTTFLR